MNKIINLLIGTLLNLFNHNRNFSNWIFSSSDNEKFNYNSKYLFEYILENKPNINPKFVINDIKLKKELQNQYGENYFIDTKTINGIKTVLNSGVWLTSAGLPVYGLNLNKNRLIINLWHGVPLKRIALMEANVKCVTKIYFKHIFSKNYSLILTTSKVLAPIMAKSFGVSKDKVKTWGQPRNDELWIEHDRQKVLYDLYGELPLYKNIILYAPTYRDDRATNLFPFDDLKDKELSQFLEDNKLLFFIRCHQSDVQKKQCIYGERVKFINDDIIEDIMEIINIFDLLITDYSSIYIDYLLTQKPLLFLPYDKDQYLKERGFNFEYNKVTPGPKPSSFFQFKKEILMLLNNENYFKNDRKKINDYFNDIKKPSSEYIYQNIMREIQKIN